MKKLLLSILALLKKALSQKMDNFSRDQLEQAMELIENVLETE